MSANRDALEVLVHQLAAAPLSGVVRAIAQLLNVSEAQLPRRPTMSGQNWLWRWGQTRCSVSGFDKRRLLTLCGDCADRNALRAAGGRVAVKGASRRMNKYLGRT